MITKVRLYRSIKSAAGKPCPYCRRPMLLGDGKNRAPSRDHILPRAKGGTLSHRIICCVRCNQDKDDRTLRDWARHLKARRDPRASHVAETIAALYGWLGHSAYEKAVGPKAQPDASGHPKGR